MACNRGGSEILFGLGDLALLGDDSGLLFAEEIVGVLPLASLVLYCISQLLEIFLAEGLGEIVGSLACSLDSGVPGFLGGIHDLGLSRSVVLAGIGSFILWISVVFTDRGHGLRQGIDGLLLSSPILFGNFLWIGDTLDVGIVGVKLSLVSGIEDSSRAWDNSVRSLTIGEGEEVGDLGGGVADSVDDVLLVGVSISLGGLPEGQVGGCAR